MPINNNWDIFGDGPVPAPEPGWANIVIPQVQQEQEHLVGMGPAVIWDEVAALPEAPQEQVEALNQALGNNHYNQAQGYHNQEYKIKGMFTSKKSKTMATPSASQLSDEYRDLTYQIEGLKGSLARESEELASVLEKIATQVEVVRDIGSLIRSRISTLQMAANRLENWRLSLPQPGSPGSLQEPPVGHYEPAQVGPPAQAGQVQVGPGLWQQDQV